jgi:hypothetical protein
MEDVLSQNIVNWTLSNNHIRKELTFAVGNPVNTGDLVSEIKEYWRNMMLLSPTKSPKSLPGKQPRKLLR